MSKIQHLVVQNVIIPQDVVFFTIPAMSPVDNQPYLTTTPPGPRVSLLKSRY